VVERRRGVRGRSVQYPRRGQGCEEGEPEQARASLHRLEGGSECHCDGHFVVRSLLNPEFEGGTAEAGAHIALGVDTRAHRGQRVRAPPVGGVGAAPRRGVIPATAAREADEPDLATDAGAETGRETEVRRVRGQGHVVVTRDATLHARKAQRRPTRATIYPTRGVDGKREIRGHVHRTEVVRSARGILKRTGEGHVE